MVKTWRGIALLWCWPWAVLAAPAVHPCAGIALPAERLGCYDTAFPHAPEIQAAARERAVQAFGAASIDTGLRNPGQAQAELDPALIEARVERIDHAGSTRRFVLANGQIWRAVDAGSHGHLAAGDAVVIRRAVLGGYQLLTPAGVGVRVRRLR